MTHNVKEFEFSITYIFVFQAVFSQAPLYLLWERERRERCWWRKKKKAWNISILYNKLNTLCQLRRVGCLLFGTGGQPLICSMYTEKQMLVLHKWIAEPGGTELANEGNRSNTVTLAGSVTLTPVSVVCQSRGLVSESSGEKMRWRVKEDKEIRIQVHLFI